MDEKQIAEAVAAAVKAEIGGLDETIKASVAESVSDTIKATVKDEMKGVLEKNNAHLAQDALVTATLQKHVDRGAITASEFATEKALVMGADDADKMLKDRDTFLGKLPDGDNPNSTIQGTGDAQGTMKANIETFMETMKKDGKTEEEILTATMDKFPDHWDDFAWTEDVQGDPNADNVDTSQV